MRVAIKEQIQKDVRETSHYMGIEEKEFVDRALLLYLESVRKILDVDKEFRVWDALSDESFYEFTRRIQEIGNLQS